MAVLVYWKSRLEDRCPIANSIFWVDKVTYRPNQTDPFDHWPRAVARYAMYGDYLAWHKLYNLQFFEGPKPASELVFFATMNPWVYTTGKKQQVRSYPLPQQLHHAGEWNEGRVNKYFIRLDSWETHCAAFQLNTGIDILTRIRYRDPVAGDLVDDIIRKRRGNLCEDGTRVAVM